MAERMTVQSEMEDFLKGCIHPGLSPSGMDCARAAFIAGAVSGMYMVVEEGVNDRFSDDQNARYIEERFLECQSLIRRVDQTQKDRINRRN